MADSEKEYGEHQHPSMDRLGEVAKDVKQSISDELHPVAEQTAELLAHGLRTPVLRRPDEVGLQYEDVFFPSLDGVPLDGWFIPADSNKLLVVDHPLSCNRYGFPGHLPPWNTMFGGFEVNFLPELKHLHDAGYNIVTYDIRNHGLSGIGNGGIVGIGLLEWRDVVGSLRYVRGRKDLASMTLGLSSRCLGANSTMVAMSRMPGEFRDVRCLVALQPVSSRTFVEKTFSNLNLDPVEGTKLFEERIHELTGFHMDELTPIPYAKNVRVPTLQVQLRRDKAIDVSDSQTIFDELGATEKELFWIEGSDQRFHAYNYFGQHPERLLDWLARYMGDKARAEHGSWTDNGDGAELLSISTPADGSSRGRRAASRAASGGRGSRTRRPPVSRGRAG
ncbi:MAG TPA: alpha/beta hydrolase [Labilithrix sp.]|nr:alpha/beta hydrolase [Labilithrix sp.]